MGLTKEEKERIVEEVVRIIRSPKREELLRELRSRLAAGKSDEEAREMERELSEVVLAVAEAISDLVQPPGGGAPPDAEG